MKGLTIHQPWATAIALGCKRYETRSYRTHYRGPLAIHAGAKKDLGTLAHLSIHFEWEAVIRPFYPHGAYANALPFGAIVAVADLVDCIPVERIGREMMEHRWHAGQPAYPYWTENFLGNFRPNRFAWQLENVRRLPEPVRYRGEQGLFNVPDDALPPEFRPSRGPQ